MALAIRANIPDCRQTNAKYFPEYEYRDYPKIMLNKHGEPICDNPVFLMTTPRYDSEDPQKVMRNGRPVVIGGDFAIVHNPDEEQEFLDQHPEAAVPVVVEFEPNAKRLAQINAENAQMEEALRKRADLKKLLAEPAVAAPKGRRGRPPKAAKAAAEPAKESFEQFSGATEQK